MDKNTKIKNWPRHTVQTVWAALTNSHVSGFITGKIYTGKMKNAQEIQEEVRRNSWEIT